MQLRGLLLVALLPPTAAQQRGWLCAVPAGRIFVDNLEEGFVRTADGARPAFEPVTEDKDVESRVKSLFTVEEMAC